MIDTVLFDLDGTLLPMDQNRFLECYMGLLAEHMSAYDYEPQKLIKTVWQGTFAMIANRGEKTNKEAFWDVFRDVYGPRADTDMDAFEEFYATSFAKARTKCGFNPAAAELIAELKNKGVRVILATNPLFPEIATLQRIRWAGLDPQDFEIITTYENSHWSKPTEGYYLEVLNAAGVEPHRCLMVGNDVRDDMPAEKVGMDVFLLTDCLLHGDDVDLSGWKKGGFDELRDYLRTEIQ